MSGPKFAKLVAMAEVLAKFDGDDEFTNDDLFFRGIKK